jgi:hypothetical protein
MRISVVIVFCFSLLIVLTGCGTLGSSTTDLVLSGTGGAIGYEVSGKKIGGAAIGAASGLVLSKVAQAQVGKAITEAEQRGYDRAMNQAVKQQYWITQNLQKRNRRDGEGEDETGARTLAITLPETVTDDGVILKSSTEYIRTIQ